MRASIVKIGNSQGLRIPKTILQTCGMSIGTEVELSVARGKLSVEPARVPRQGWAELAAEMSASGDDRLLDAPESTEFDADEWEW